MTEDRHLPNVRAQNNHWTRAMADIGAHNRKPGVAKANDRRSHRKDRRRVNRWLREGLRA